MTTPWARRSEELYEILCEDLLAFLDLAVDGNDFLSYRLPVAKQGVGFLWGGRLLYACAKNPRKVARVREVMPLALAALMAHGRMRGPGDHFPGNEISERACRRAVGYYARIEGCYERLCGRVAEEVEEMREGLEAGKRDRGDGDGGEAKSEECDERVNG